LGKDLAVEGRADSTAEFGGSDDVPLFLPALPDGHDRGITHDPQGFARMFVAYPDRSFIGLDEYIGYQHASLQTQAVEGTGFTLTVAYDPHYCRALIAKGSTWNLDVSDWMRARMGPDVLSVDGKPIGPIQQEQTALFLRAGSGLHTIEVKHPGNKE
jgi:hypothetical protein